MKPRVAIFCSGRGSNMQALIEAANIPAYPAEIALVISNKAEAPALEIARNLGVDAGAVASKPFGKDRLAHEQAIDAMLTEARIELVCLAGYMRLLSPYLVGRWAGRMLNIHPSLLPAYPGLNTHGRALAAGEKTHGCTVHLVTEIMDEGPILAQARVPVHADDTEATLASRVLAREHELYPAALAEFAATFPLPDRTASR